MYQNYIGYQPNVTRNTNIDWIRVGNCDQAKSVYVHPGQTAWIMIENENIISAKTADLNGMMTQRWFKLEEFAPDEEHTDYATRTELNEINVKLDRLMEVYNNEQSVINNNAT